MSPDCVRCMPAGVAAGSPAWAAAAAPGAAGDGARCGAAGGGTVGGGALLAAARRVEAGAFGARLQQRRVFGQVLAVDHAGDRGGRCAAGGDQDGRGDGLDAGAAGFGGELLDGVDVGFELGREHRRGPGDERCLARLRLGGRGEELEPDTAAQALERAGDRRQRLGPGGGEHHGADQRDEQVAVGRAVEPHRAVQLAAHHGARDVARAALRGLAGLVLVLVDDERDEIAEPGNLPIDLERERRRRLLDAAGDDDALGRLVEVVELDRRLQRFELAADRGAVGRRDRHGIRS